ncbi:MAG: hypothetical protein ACRDY1_01150 [Acidimicrobiales bacterium]
MLAASVTFLALLAVAFTGSVDAQAAAPSWTVAATPAPSGFEGTQLQGVSCPTTTFCVAVGADIVGSAGPGDVAYQALIETTDDGRIWTTDTSVPGPPGMVTSSLGGVSCPSSTFCMAVGSYNTANSNGTLVDTFNGTSWSYLASPANDTPGIYSQAFDAVSCVSSSLCVAVGDFYYGTVGPLMESWAEGTWSYDTDVSDLSPSTGQLTSISCSSATWCVAAGWQGSGYDLTTFAESYDGTEALSEQTPNPQPAGLASQLFGISCWSADDCLAVGESNATPGNPATADTLVESDSGGTWTLVGSASVLGQLRAVSCPGPSLCAAAGSSPVQVDGSLLNESLVETMDGSTWSTTPTPDPASVLGNVLEANSCTGAAPGGTPLCVAAGDSGYSPSPSVPAPLVMTSTYPELTTLTLTSSPDPSNAGQSVTLTALVAGSDGGGTVAFSAAGAPLSGCTAVGLTATSTLAYVAKCVTSTLPPGFDAVGAAYSGDNAAAGSSGSLPQAQEVDDGPAVTTQPVSQTVNLGSPATLTAAATGPPVPTVQWQQSTDGGTTFTAVTGATTDTYDFTPTAYTQNGTEFRAVFTNSKGSVSSDPAVITVPTPTTLVVRQDSGQSAYASQLFATYPEVQVVDQFGLDMYVAGVPVTFSAPGSGPSGTFLPKGGSSMTVASSNGQAGAEFVADATSGSYVVTASSPGLTSATFTLTNLTVPTPSVSSIAPASFVRSRSAQWSFQVNGSGFIPGATVVVTTSTGAAVKGATVSITQVTASQLSGYFVLRKAAKPGTYSLAVSNDASHRATCTGCLTVTKPPRRHRA